jgi:alkanesulfonate monooxygenase SsuD/methylene tetrahydromethanopterin reductase-like flavin-dependent oxidoreductase (luciferase family)
VLESNRLEDEPDCKAADQVRQVANEEPVPKLGFAVPVFAAPGISDLRTPSWEALDWETARNAAIEAERLGYDSIWVGDHLALGPTGAILEGWTTLAALAGATRRVRLGTIHLCAGFRAAPMLAKMAATLDVISDGRLELFLDTGFREVEYRSYGFDWADRARRVARLAETIEVVRALWQGGPIDFQGEWSRLDEAICRPTPRQSPGPRIWLGETFDDILELVVHRADVWNSVPAPLDELREKLRRLDAACEAAGRDPATLPRTLETQVLIYDEPAEGEELFARFAALRSRNRAGAQDGDLAAVLGASAHELAPARERFVIGTPTEVAGRLAEYASLGIDEIICWFMDFPARTSMRRLVSEVVPLLALGARRRAARRGGSASG